MATRIIKNLVPNSFKHMLKSYLRRMEYIGDTYYCPLCGTSLSHFDPMPRHYFEKMQEYGYIFSLFTAETYSPVTYLCPHCGGSDRTRLYKHYFANRFQELDQSRKYKFIDFAPDSHLISFFRSCEFLEYRTADLMMANVDDKVDITDMRDVYEDDSVDIFMCSHVLEHIPDDRQAIRELYRITRPDGWGLIMAPIILTLEEDYEDPTITSVADKWKHFAQDDHVRLYSKSGFVAKLEEAGFKVNQLDVSYFGKEELIRMGLNLNSVLYIVEKVAIN